VPDTLPSTKAQHRIVVNAVGTAKPAMCAAVAKGLGLTTSVVVSRLYRAPAVLIEGIDESLAEQMTTLLCNIGYDAEVQNVNEPPPAKSTLYDVAVYIDDPMAFLPTVKCISKFVGMPEENASEMVLTPPGIVLGSVSEATILSFKDQLCEGCSIISSITEEAEYEIFLGHTAEIVRRRILSDIKDSDIPLVGETGLVASGVDHNTAQALWRRHQASGAMRVVNRDFLRFDLVCMGIEEGVQSGTPEQIALLKSLVGIPEDMIEEVLNSLPITLLEAVPNNAVEENVLALTEVGLTMRADLISFQVLGLQVESTSDAAATSNILKGYGLLQEDTSLPIPPFTVEGRLPELRAKIIKSSLEEAGAVVTFVEENE